MTEEVQSAPTEQAQQTEAPAQNESVAEQHKTSNDERVELSPEQQKRFNQIYRQVKILENENKEYKSVAQQQFEAIEALRQSQEQVVSHLQNKDYADVEAQLKQQRKQARENGDYDALDEINDRLEEIRIKKLAAQNTPKQEKQIKPRVTNASEAASYAASQNAITAEEQSVIAAWQEEVSDTGESVRPWAFASDPRYQAALIESRAVFTNPNFANKSVAEKLKEVDRRMGVMDRQPQQAVMGSSNGAGANLTRGSRNDINNVKIDPKIEKMAVYHQFAGPGKTKDEHIAAYKRQILQIKGARK